MTPIILCATPSGRAVLFGYIAEAPISGQPVTLLQARMVLKWRGCGGLFGIAAEGPRDHTSLTSVVPSVTVTEWAQWIAVTPSAAQAIADWPAS